MFYLYTSFGSVSLCSHNTNFYRSVFQETLRDLEPTSRHIRCWITSLAGGKMYNYQLNWFFVFSIICLSVAEKHYDDTKDQVYRRQSDSTRVRIPKFEFYIYNDVGNMVKQYLTVREIQQLLLQQSLRLGPRSRLIRVKSENFIFQE